jgi:hypothetical protein
MRKTLVVLMAMMMVGMTIPAFAELQNVQVGGSLRIRGNWYNEGTTFNKDLQNDQLYVEQRTRVNVGADFTDDVHAFIELDNYGNWGDDFRGLDSSGLLTGADGTSNSLEFYESDRGIPTLSSDNSVSLYQAYVEMKDAWGAPIDIKIGRSEMVHGDEFLVGNNDTSSQFRGLSFDGVWATYNNDSFNVSGFFTRIVQDVTGESSGDADFMGVYGSYTGIENMTIDGYYYYFHAQNADFTSSAQGDNTHIHTVGARFAGNAAQFDWAGNAAYQFGDSGLGEFLSFTDADTVDVSAFGVQGAVGYTFDVNMQPRIFANGAYYSGAELNDDGSIDQFGFNRLFSDHEYSEFIDNTDLTNVWFVGGGVSAQVTEAISLTGVANWFNAVENLEDVFGSGAPDENDLGIEVALYAKYDYSEDLYFQMGYAHFFAGKAMEDGALVNSLGVGFTGGFGEQDDVDYVFLETGISF